MKPLETEHLILRKFTEDDFAAVHSYASCAVFWGGNPHHFVRDNIAADKLLEYAFHG
jgi:RimJ/RimL family protein N-acetyltransferase